MKAGDRVKLTLAARAEVWKYGDVGTRAGTIARIDGWIIVRFDGLDGESRVPPADVEAL